MRALIRSFCLVLCFTVWVPVVQAQTPAQTPAPAANPAPQPTLTPAQAQGVLDVLQDEKKRQAFVTVLQSMLKAAPAVAEPAKPAAVNIAADSIGARLVVQVSHGVQETAGQIAAMVAAVNDTPLLYAWAVGIFNDPTA
ncbi:MAG: hypothetical protein ACRYG8_27930, partial [Janthinobacterium lividum]